MSDQGPGRAWVDHRPGRDGPTIRLGGELDIAGAAELAPRIDALLRSHRQPAVIDLGEVRFMDSSGVALLIRLANHFAPTAVERANPAVRRTLQALGLTATLPTVPGPTAVERTFAREVPSVPASRRCLAEAVPDLPAETVQTACLLVSELATNAVLHGGGDRFELAVRVDPVGGCLVVSVTDSGGGRPRVLDPGAGDEHGRGLQLVSALADDWGVRAADPAGAKTVWFELRTPGTPHPAAEPGATAGGRQGSTGP